MPKNTINTSGIAAEANQNMKMKFKRVVLAAALVILLVAILASGKNMWSSKPAASSGYQAVFLTNGQVYFGKMSFSRNWVVLKDIYYLQVTQQLQPAQSAVSNNDDAQPNIQLVKLGSELHGPEDVMYIDKDKILFWENMKADSKVVEAIQRYQENRR